MIPLNKVTHRIWLSAAYLQMPPPLSHNSASIVTMLACAFICTGHTLGYELQAPPTPSQEKVRKISEDRYQVGRVIFDKKSRELRIPAKINMRTGLLDYAFVTNAGKIHESLLITEVSPWNLNVALLLLRFQISKPVVNPCLIETKRIRNEPESVVQKSKLDIRLEWHGATGEKSMPLESCVKGLETGTLASREPWIYTGSEISNCQFVAQSDGAIVGLYLDPVTMINNPRHGNFDDETWSPISGLPEIGTDVTVIMSPPKPGR